MDREIVEVITTTFQNYSIERSVQQRFEQFVTLMLDRFLTGHYIGKMNPEHYRLGARDEFEIVNILVDNIGNLLDVEIPLEEKIFVFLPILGMRTPADITKLGPIKLDSNIPVLMESIIASIRQEMNINLVSNEFTQEFLYHLMFMCNRLKYGIKFKILCWRICSKNILWPIRWLVWLLESWNEIMDFRSASLKKVIWLHILGCS